MDKDIVTLSREYYDKLREMEQNHDKIAWYNSGLSRAECRYQYFGKDETIKYLEEALQQKDKKLQEKSKPSYRSGLKARIRFLFTGNITLRS